MTTPVLSAPTSQHCVTRVAWHERWWRLMALRIGIVSVPVYLLSLACISYFIYRMQTPPFAQTATRIGGAITITLSLIAFALHELEDGLSGVFFCREIFCPGRR